MCVSLITALFPEFVYIDPRLPPENVCLWHLRWMSDVYVGSGINTVSALTILTPFISLWVEGVEPTSSLGTLSAPTHLIFTPSPLPGTDIHPFTCCYVGDFLRIKLNCDSTGGLLSRCRRCGWSVTLSMPHPVLDFIGADAEPLNSLCYYRTSSESFWLNPLTPTVAIWVQL